MKNTKLRFWMGALALIGGIACVLAVFFGTVGAAAGRGSEESPQPQSAIAPSTAQTYDGVVTDTKCGAKHSPAIAANAADCTRVCVHAGEHFALVDGDKVYVLEGEPELLKRAAGERVTVGGTLNGDTISVTSVRELAR